ncbi:uncharacterized protein BX664DRAFT_320315 [Halteromyces radiatus]|uniref:uncharacterized protein n=1 Tax=Halteromyces radiatus TaxID=101107 RepID=UPI00221FC1B6|nr:uncharacterized protein BX664DRAFT_320315 [Halteromyces radiatus]KAI8099069.1 hypothetical protein BX664DRAFT_320315 [Halteromyces radiatus]
MSHHLIFILSLIISCLLVTDAVKVQGKLETNGVLTDLRRLRPSTKVTLSGIHSTFIQSDGSFVFDDVTPGSYLLEVNNIDFIFPKLRVDIKENEVAGSYTGLGAGWDKTGYALPHPFVLRAKAEADYFVERQGFNVIGMFKNPMFLMLGFSGLMMLVMPKMLQNLDPEAMKDITQTQTDAQNIMNDMPTSLSQMFAKAQQQAQQQQRSSSRK